MARVVDRGDLEPAPLPPDELETAAARSLAELRTSAVAVAELAERAPQLEERLRALHQRERELVDGETRVALGKRGLEAQGERLLALAADLAHREDLVHAERERVESARAELVEREARFASRWRLLLRAWRWRPPLPGRKVRVCELLFVPSSEGYKLLEQEGVALRPGAIVTGLLAEERTFVVTKIAPWSFDGRWCAYLQQESQPQPKGVT